jgi:hypothetical protein
MTIQRARANAIFYSTEMMMLVIRVSWSGTSLGLEARSQQATAMQPAKYKLVIRT